jgi:hypothetical protein
MTAGPAVEDETVTPGVAPAPSVVEGLPAIVPRLEEKVTCEPTTGTPPVSQVIETAVAVFKGMSTFAAGVVNAKLEPLIVSA